MELWEQQEEERVRTSIQVIKSVSCEWKIAVLHCFFFSSPGFTWEKKGKNGSEKLFKLSIFIVQLHSNIFWPGSERRCNLSSSWGRTNANMQWAFLWCYVLYYLFRSLLCSWSVRKPLSIRTGSRGCWRTEIYLKPDSKHCGGRFMRYARDDIEIEYFCEVRKSTRGSVILPENCKLESTKWWDHLFTALIKNRYSCSHSWVLPLKIFVNFCNSLWKISTWKYLFP